MRNSLMPPSDQAELPRPGKPAWFSYRHDLPATGGFPEVQQEIWDLSVISPIPTTGRSVDGTDLVVKIFRYPREDGKRAASFRAQVLNQVADVLVGKVTDFADVSRNDDHFLAHLLVDEKRANFPELSLHLL